MKTTRCVRVCVRVRVRALYALSVPNAFTFMRSYRALCARIMHMQHGIGSNGNSLIGLVQTESLAPRGNGMRPHLRQTSYVRESRTRYNLSMSSEDADASFVSPLVRGSVCWQGVSSAVCSAS